MVRLQIPYRLVLMNPRDFDPADFDGTVRDYLGRSRKAPLVIEVFNENIQYLLFLNEGQLYWACASEADGFRPVRLRDFFLEIRRTQFPKIIAYQTDIILYHSLLVFLQKKPELKVSSALVDLEELLDRVEKDRLNAIVSSRNPGNLFFLRYQSGKAIACYHLRSEKGPATDAREDFLVKAFTITAKRPLEINLFTDLAVTHAEDVRSLPPDYKGSIQAFYLSQPPRLVVRLKGRPLKTYPFAGTEMSVGRLPENEIVIDNLSVSRKHATISSSQTGYTLHDLGSKNGTCLNGKPVSEAALSDGDAITIGKYEILFQVPALEEGNPESMDQTVIIPHFKRDATAAQPREADKEAVPHLFRKSAMEEYPLDRERTVIGRGRDSHIRLGGIFAPRLTVAVVRKGSEYVLQKIEGRKKVTINGEEMDEKTLEKEDLIAIGSEEFVFKD
ncbi:MAG: FHA domain-containing protein [Candidatus Krumholzibacteria bacterium]|nr:FHA domain-containing protein [Candidatus Krumholzibacteria bacterium]